MSFIIQKKLSEKVQEQTGNIIKSKRVPLRMDLLEVLHSIDSSFSGNLDDTLLNRLSTILRCNNFTEHHCFWSKFEAACNREGKEKMAIDDLLISLFSRLTDALQLETLFHPNIIKVVFGLLERYLPLSQSVKELLTVVHKFIASGLTNTLVETDVHCAMLESCHQLVSSSIFQDEHVKSVLYFVLTDSVIASALDIYTSSTSIFLRKIGLQFIGRVIYLHYKLSVAELSVSLTNLKSRILEDVTFTCEILSSILTQFSLNECLEISHTFISIFEETLLSIFEKDTLYTNISIHIFIFYLSWNQLEENSQFKILSIINKFSTDNKMDALIQLIRLASWSNVNLNMKHPLIEPSLRTAFEVNLRSAISKRDVKCSRRYLDALSLLKSPIHISKPIVAYIFDEIMVWMKSCSWVSRFFLCLDLKSSQKVEVFNALLQYSSTGSSEQLQVLESLVLEFIKDGNLKNDMLVRVISTIKPFVLQESKELDSMLFLFFYGHLLNSISTDDSLSELEFLLSCQQNSLAIYLKICELRLFPCFYLETVLQLLSKDLRHPLYQENALSVLLNMFKTIEGEGNGISEEFRELLLSVSLCLFLSLDENSVSFLEMKTMIVTLSTSQFDFPLSRLSHIMPSIFTAATIEGRLLSLPQFEIISQVTASILDNGILDWQCVDTAWLSALESFLVVCESSDNPSIVKSQLRGIQDVRNLCSHCGESIDNLLRDILVAKETASKLDCVGD